MKTVALTALLLLARDPRPPEPEPYQGQCSVKVNENQCRAKAQVQVKTCILKAEEKFFARFKHGLLPNSDGPLLTSRIKKCTDRYWYMTGETIDPVEVSEDFQEITIQHVLELP